MPERHPRRPQPLQGARNFPGFLVGSLGGERVEHVGDGDNAPLQGNRLARQSARISAAVEFLVMRPGDQGGQVEQARLAFAQDLVALLGMRAHDHQLGVVEPPGLEQDVIGNGDLADVVHGGGAQDEILFLARQSELLGDQARIVGHALDVGAGLRVAEFGGARQAGDHFTLAIENLDGGLGDFLGQPGGAILQGFLVAPQGHHVEQAGAEFRAVDGLGQEIVGAGFQRRVACGFLMVGGDHQQRNVCIGRHGAEAADEFQPVRRRHHVVDDDHVRCVVQHPGQTLRGILKDLRGEIAGAPNQALHELEVHRVVVDDHDAHGGLRAMPAYRIIAGRSLM